MTETAAPVLRQTLGPWMLWALGVGLVISGEYFGWNLGLPAAGPVGMLIATLLMTVMYVCFVLSYAELACAMPRAGGLLVYATRAGGTGFGMLGGLAQLIEFLFCPPAIALAIGAYLTIYFPSASPIMLALICYVVFTALNIWGVKMSAIFELVITVLAVGELLLFCGVTAPHASWSTFVGEAPLPNGIYGIMAAIPFAIWLFVAIEGVANSAEEVAEPRQRNITIGFIGAIITLVVLALATVFCAVGVGGWEKIVTNADGTSSDKPLPLAMAQVVGDSSGLFHLLVGIGLLGLVASFHGILMVAGRATFEYGRMGYAPKALGTVWAARGTPAWAMIANLVVGVIAVLSGKTGELITIAAFAALVLYIIAMLTVFLLRRKEPAMNRPYRTPGYPVVPAIALVVAVISLAAMTYYNLALAGWFCGMLAVGFLWYGLTRKRVQVATAATE